MKGPLSWQCGRARTLELKPPDWLKSGSHHGITQPTSTACYLAVWGVYINTAPTWLRRGQAARSRSARRVRRNTTLFHLLLSNVPPKYRAGLPRHDRRACTSTFVSFGTALRIHTHYGAGISCWDVRLRLKTVGQSSSAPGRVNESPEADNCSLLAPSVCGLNPTLDGLVAHPAS